MRRRVLLTAFEPFGGETLNSSWELLRALAAEPSPHDDLVLCVECLPVHKDHYAEALAQAIERHRPEVVLALGQAGGRPTIQLERQAFNRLDYEGAVDNGGHRIAGQVLHPDAPETLAASLPLERLCAVLRAAGHPVDVSADAGRFLCNAVLYELRHVHSGLAAAFVHIPLLPEQAASRGRGEASLGPRVTLACLRDLLRQLALDPAGSDGGA